MTALTGTCHATAVPPDAGLACEHPGCTHPALVDVQVVVERERTWCAAATQRVCVHHVHLAPQRGRRWMFGSTEGAPMLPVDHLAPSPERAEG